MLIVDASMSFLHLKLERLGRNGHGCVATVNARILHVLHNGTDEYVFSVGDAIDFDFFGTINEFADNNGVVASNFRCQVKEASRDISL